MDIREELQCLLEVFKSWWTAVTCPLIDRVHLTKRKNEKDLTVSETIISICKIRFSLIELS